MSDSKWHGITVTSTLALGVITGGLTLGLTENYGQYKNDGSVAPAADSDRLVGSYAAALIAISAAMLPLLLLSLYSTGARWRKAPMRALLHGGTLLTLVLLLTLASLNIYVLEKFDAIGSIDLVPATPEADQKLRGSTGLAMVSLASISLGFSVLAVVPTLWAMVKGVPLVDKRSAVVAVNVDEFTGSVDDPLE